MRYTVKRIKHAAYELENELGQSWGTLKFNVWSMSKAKAVIAGNEYDFYAVGFWQQKKVMAQNGILLAELNFKLGKGYDISFPNKGRLFFRKKGFWTASEYILIDEHNTVFATLHMEYSWKRWSYNYSIEIHDNFFAAELKDIIPVIMFYSAILMLRMKQSAG